MHGRQGDTSNFRILFAVDLRNRMILVLLARKLVHQRWQERVKRREYGHHAWHEHRPLPVVDRLDASCRHYTNFEARFVRVGFAHCALVDGRGAEGALDGRGQDVRERDAGVLD